MQEIKFYTTSGNSAYIDGASPYGPYRSNKLKSAVYGMNSAYAYRTYINDLSPKPGQLDADTFVKKQPLNVSDGDFENYIEQMESGLNELSGEELPPVNFLLRYAPKMGSVKGFFKNLFSGNKIDTQALLGNSYQEMGRSSSISLEESDAPFKSEAFSDVNANLTSKAFDVNNDGRIDMSEMAVSTVIADILSKDDSLNPMDITVSDIKKADGSYTNDGENKMLAFCKEENLETASGIVKDIHTKLKLDKAQDKFFDNMHKEFPA